MASISDDKWMIDKLGSKNWITWKFQMRHVLQSKGLYGLVEGTKVLAQGAMATATKEFE